MQVIAARTAETAPVLLDMPEPGSPGPGQILCETLQLGVCGTDREILETRRREGYPEFSLKINRIL